MTAEKLPDSIMLKARRDSINDQIESKRTALSTSLAEGKDGGKLIDDIARLETEACAMPAAISQAEQRELEQMTLLEKAKADQRKKAREQLYKQECEVVILIEDLVKAFDELDSFRVSAELYEFQLQSPRFINLVRSELHRQMNGSPLLFGLPPARTKHEKEMIEAQIRLERAEIRLEGMKQIRKSREYRVLDSQLERAEDDVRRAKIEFEKVKISA